MLEDTVSDSVLWVKINEGAFGFECIIGAVYIACEDSDYHNNSMFDNIAEDILNFNCNLNIPVLMIGDFNSRTSTIDDFVTLDESIAPLLGVCYEENDIFNSNTEMERLGITTLRSNMHNKNNNNGYKLIELCKVLI